MNSNRTSKFNTPRPGSSAKVQDYVNSSNGKNEISKIPKYPKRTYSLENRTSFIRTKVSATSMIPRLEIKKFKNNALMNNKNRKIANSNIPFFEKKIEGEQTNALRTEKPTEEISNTTTVIGDCSPIPVKKTPSLERKVSEDFINFKNNILKIPEYWTDAGKTAASILKNAVNIVQKQYPNVEKETFEAEIESIVKATEAVKEQMLSKTEHIINKASEICTESNGTQWNKNDEDNADKLDKSVEEFNNEMMLTNYDLRDVLKYSSDVKQLKELKKVFKKKIFAKKSPGRESSDSSQRKSAKEEGQQKKKCKKVDNTTVGLKKKETSPLQNDADFKNQDSNFFKEKKDNNSDQQTRKNKTTQTLISWNDELIRNKINFAELNQKIIELQELCKDHISKFKSFNLQIELKGICNKAQRISVNKELEILNDEKVQLEEKNSKLLCHNKDLETAIKKKDLDLHQKEKLIVQQKKLLHVRDELIEMLKNRCNLEERQYC